MVDMLPLDPADPRSSSTGEAIGNNQDIPTELDIFWQDESEFLPPGKTWSDLTEDERKIIRDQYRFAPYKPGIYQGITGMTPMV